MKEAIEKAIKNGFDALSRGEGYSKIFTIRDIVTDGTLVIIKFKDLSDEYNDEGNIYNLIFGTDFIDKLVGLKRISSLCDINKNPDTCNRECNNPCSLALRNADEHRAWMANIKDIKTLKEYVRGLV